MTTVCLYVKPTALHPGMPFLAVTLLGPRWSGERLSLDAPEELGLPRGDIIGWSDFYGGGPCEVQVARATSGQEAGYLVWGGTLGLRIVPPELREVERRQGDLFEMRTVLWVKDPLLLPAHVRAVVEGPHADAPAGAGEQPELAAAPATEPPPLRDASPERVAARLRGLNN